MEMKIWLELLCFAVLLLLVSSVPTTYPGTFSTSAVNNHGPYSFVGSGANNAVQVNLTFNSASDVSQILMQVKTTNTAPSLNQRIIDYYDHKNPTAYTTYDLHGANTGQKQVVNVGGLTGGNQIYIFVINFNSQANSSYTITVSQRTGINQICAPGNVQSPTSIYCSSCVNSLQSGPFCDLNSPNMSNNVSYSFTLYAFNDARGSFGTMTIPASNSDFILYYTTSNINLVNAIQFKYFQTEVAGIMNYASGGLKSISQYNTQYSISVSTGSTNDVSISFLNLNSNAMVVNVWFAVKTSSNVLIIVLSILGGILFVGLVVVALCIVRRMRSNEHQQVSPLSAMMVRANTIRVNNPNDLTTQQIETYFPGVLCRNVLNEEQPSSNNLNNAAQKEGTGDRDCVICLCPVVSTEMIKITYCRHLFHAQCLNKWFEKQRNCPYCREEYNRKSTMQHYQTLLGISHKNMLAGIDLVKEIMVKPIKSALVIEEIKE